MTGVAGGAGPTLGYYWGDDDFGLERAVERLAERMAVVAGEPVERWRIRGDARSGGEAAGRIAEVAERVGTAPFFGGGTLVVVTEPGGLARWKQERTTITDVLGTVAPGNGLAFIETFDAYGRRSATLEALGRAVATAGGETREIRAPREGQMARWIQERGAERHVLLGRGAAQELAVRIGAFVREADVDRRRQGRLAVSELDKLALYRPGGEISVDDVRALVPEAIPGSVWALQDAIALRQAAVAAQLAERLLQATPVPVLLAVLHRRIRELIQVADLARSGTSPADLIRILKLKPYPAGKLMDQARAWTPEQLEAALEGLLDLDIAVKGSDGQGVSEGQVHLALMLWIADHVQGPAGRR